MNPSLARTYPHDLGLCGGVTTRRSASARFVRPAATWRLPMGGIDRQFVTNAATVPDAQRFLSEHGTSMSPNGCPWWWSLPRLGAEEETTVFRVRSVLRDL